MIIGFFMQIGLSVMSFIVGKLPIVAFPSGITAGVVLIGGYINQWTWLFPVSHLLAALTIALIFHGVLIGWYYLHMVIRYIRGR